MKKQAIKWVLCLCLLLAMMPAAMADEVTPPHTGTDGHAAPAVALNDLTYSVSAPTTLSGDTLYYLNGNLEIGDDGQTPASDSSCWILVPTGKTVTICLNGFSLTGAYNCETGDILRYLIRVNGTLNICDCSTEKTGSIVYNSASAAGAATIVTQESGTLNIFGGNICGNKNGKYGAVHVASGTVNMYGGKISDNESFATGYGGGVGLTQGATFNMYGGEISNNISNGTDYGLGGGIYVASENCTVNIYGGAIKGNTAMAAKALDEIRYRGGGGICVANAASSLNLYGGEISGNTATGNGGGITSVGTLTIPADSTVVIKENSATQGGGIYTGGTFTMAGGEISANNATDGGGVMAASVSGEMTVSGGTIKNNAATADGGGIFGYQGMLQIDNGTISGNTAKNGGGIRVENTITFTLNNGEISGNTASGNGGGICQNLATMAIKNGTISGNSANNGGGIYYDSNTKLEISDGTIQNNIATAYGGGICEMGGSLQLEKVTITQNRADMGGGVYTRRDFKMESFDVNISYNTARVGGGICQGGATEGVINTVILYAGVISYNNAVEGGGGVYLGTAEAGSFMEGNTYILNNICGGFGAGLYTVTPGGFEIKGGTISGNETRAVEVDADGNVVIGEQIAKGGGAIYNDGVLHISATKGTVIIRNVNKNDCNHNGAAIYNKGEITMDDGTVSSAATTGTGKAVYNSGTFTMNGGSITSNYAKALHNYGGTLIMNGGTISSIGASGNGIAKVYGGECEISVGDNNGVFELYGGIFASDHTDTVNKTNKESVTKLVNGIYIPRGNGTYELVESKWTGTNMLLGKTLDMNIYFDGADEEYGYYSYSDEEGVVWNTSAPATAKITYYKVDETVVVPVELLTKGETGEYVFTIESIAAKEMADKLRIDLYDEQGNLVGYWRESVRDYGRRVLGNAEMSNAHQLIADMLAYGAAAQKYFEYNVEDPADSVLANFEVTVTDPAAAITNANPADDIYYAYTRAYHSANLTLENDVDFNLYFWIGQLENTDYIISINGEEQTGVFQECLDATAPDGEPLLYKVKVAGLTYADLMKTEVSITFTEKGATTTTTITDSPVNYLVRNDGKARNSFDGEDNSALYGSALAFANSCVAYEP